MIKGLSQLISYFQQIKLTFSAFVVALFSAGVGIGGGAIFIPIFLSIFKFEYKKAAALSLATIIPIAFTGAVSHLFLLSVLP